MKKKIALLLAVSTMVASLLTGCGSNGKTTSTTGNTGNSNKKITVSQMLANEMKENNGKVYMFYQITANGFTLDDILKDENFKPHSLYVYDGYILKYFERLPDTFSEALSNASSLNVDETYDAGLYIETKNNKVCSEYFRVINDKQDMSKSFIELTFRNETGYSCHIKIDGKSYMVLSQDGKDYDGDRSYLFIKDTNYTKNKVIVFDKKGDSSKSFTASSHNICTPVTIK